MPRVSAARTGSEPKLVTVWAVLFLVVLSLLVAVPEQMQLRFGNHSYILEVARTENSREKGLSDRDNMPPTNGMLFVFPRTGNYCFWMKHMHFPLDIIWLSSQKRVVHLEPNLSPDTNPQTYCSSQPARYVIELNAGQVSETDLHLGNVLSF